MRLISFMSFPRRRESSENNEIPAFAGMTAALIMLVLVIPLKLYASSDYKEHCASCHGEHAEGSFGPALASTIDKDKFKKVIRAGQGMMPAMGEKDLSDEDVDEIYNEIALFAGEGSPDKSFFGKISGWLLAKKNLKNTAWGSVALMFFGAMFMLFARYVKWSAISNGKKYFHLLGAGQCLRIFFSTLFGDTLGVSSVYKKEKKRWFVHGLIAYGFFGLIIADILIAIVNPERMAMPFLSPIKIFANLCGMAVAIGLLIVIWRVFTDPYENNGVTFFGDLIFIVLLFVVVVSGFATEATRYLKLPSYTQYVYFAHIVFMITLIVTAPFTRFVHILSTFFFVLNTKLATRVADARLSGEFNDEPAPGRHFKSERVAKDLFGKDVKIRYFP